MDVFKVIMIGICGVLLAMILQTTSSRLYVFISVAAAVIIMSYIVIRLTGIVAQIKSLNRYISIGNEYIVLLLKIIGITYVSQFASDICKDAGNSVVATQIETFCKITIAALSLPVVLVLFETVAKCM
ncbi:MAG: SpoIIIAC/SpoIIIAD family protein [Lachnospira sp.]